MQGGGLQCKVSKCEQQQRANPVLVVVKSRRCEKWSGIPDHGREFPTMVGNSRPLFTAPGFHNHQNWVGSLLLFTFAHFTLEPAALHALFKVRLLVVRGREFPTMVGNSQPRLGFPDHG